ncbi:MAG: hypothetical protein GX621_15545 [Pirellulaceae bacterium]|nr:hypothetical protein [Pirellulaceae bacterium]
MLWGLLEMLRREGVQVQSFASRACFPMHLAASEISGRKIRYLDSWLMEEEICREFFAHGSQFADISVVDGEYNRSEAVGNGPGGELETLCGWLRLPKIVVLDASRLTGAIPERPERVDGVLLDRVTDSQHLSRWTTDIQTVWRVPVLGCLPESAGFGRKIDKLPPGGTPSSELVRELGDALGQTWHPELLHRISESEAATPVDSGFFKSERATLRLNVAVAFDDAFFRYFPCFLDLLEARGATVVDFSPLRDEHLPPDADVVLLGGGLPERHALTLAENHCMKTALRNHVRWGKRIYGEGGGLALLCQQMVSPEGEQFRMAGLLPAVARSQRSPSQPTPVETVLSRPNWMGRAGVAVRGYRDPGWTIEPIGNHADFVTCGEESLDLIGTFQTVGSLLEIHFGSQANLLNHLFYPHLCAPPTADPWRNS